LTYQLPPISPEPAGVIYSSPLFYWRIAEEYLNIKVFGICLVKKINIANFVWAFVSN